MLIKINPKLPMRNKDLTKKFYLENLNFNELADYGNYLIIEKDDIEIHFFEFKELNPKDNYGQVYIRTDNIENLYNELISKKVNIHQNGHLESKPWGQREFSLLDLDNNLLTFGQSI
ncbi:VOC family protein [Flavobacterium sp. AS60]|uniref:VOC family protein n=1 Tax=Flavobacterium anseongense TaxID=2910677 RepID=UPI001F1C802F|nr:VOC family protein [Flavobacterium sp. AS60]MCF6130486.1 VOC family protein [Flavobacterium sp. AS60]